MNLQKKLSVFLGNLFPTFSPKKKCESLVSTEFQEGGLYSIRFDDNKYGIAKILVMDDSEIHIRIYKNTFSKRPKIIDSSNLEFAIGHLPITKEQFLAWEPVFISNTSVSKDELIGYEIWKEDEGGVFDSPKTSG